MREVQSDRILDLVQSAFAVETQITTHSEMVAARLQDAFAPFFDDAEGEQPPDFRAVLQAMKDKLGEAREKLSLAEEQDISLVKEAIELRDERQALTGSLYEDFSSMRRTIEELYRGRGKGNFNAFVVAGIQGPTAQRPTRLLRQVDLATQHLLQPGFAFPASRFGAPQLEPAQLAEALQPRATRLRQVQAELRRVGSELNASRKEKNRALRAQRQMLSWVTRGAESFFHLAGEHELAERIRPTVARPRRAPEEEAEATGDASQDAEAPSEDAVEASAGEAGMEASPAGDVSLPDSPAPATVSEPTPAPAPLVSG